MKRIDLQRFLRHIVSFTVRLVAPFLLLSARLFAQSIEVYSEYWPFAGASVSPREVISPAVPRNGFSTFKVLVNAPEGASYFLFCQTNPPNLVDTHLYKIAPADLLEPVRSPNFGVIPDGQTSRAYLLDIWVPPDAEPGRRIRLELQLKIGSWIVYPLELRVQKAAVPGIQNAGDVPASLRAALERNSKQDAAFENWLQLPEVWLMTARHIAGTWTANSPFSTADDPEWYLRVRDLMIRRANAR